MTVDEKNPIVSEEYADLLIETGKMKAILQIYPEATIHTINTLISLVNVPVEYITNFTVKDLGYSVFPAVLGLVSQYSQEASGIQRLRNIPNYNLRGQGTLIGIIDTGIDYTNPIFQYADGTTRIAVIWDQTIQGTNLPSGFFYGTEYTREQINLALQSENPYELVPSKDEFGHGTMVAGIAGGKEDLANNFYGVAPEAEFVVVRLKPAKKYIKDFFCVPEGAIGYQENDVAYALNYVLDRSSSYRKPIAICISVDTSEGSHDGRGTFLDDFSLAAALPGVAITVGSGNEGNSRRHYFGTINKENGFDTVELKVGENEDNFYMQLWGEIHSILSMDIVSPSGEYSNIITPMQNEFYEITFTQEETIIYLDYQLVEPQSGTQLFFFRFINPATGVWKFNVYQTNDSKINFHIWLPMKDFITDNTYFIKADPYTTILSIAASPTAIITTAYNVEDDRLYIDASKGYTRIGGITPSIAAPGVNVIGPTLDKAYAEFTGTSVSAAHMAGVAALLLEWGVVRDNLSSMSSVHIKNMIELGARRNLSISYPNQDWGYGILDIYYTFHDFGVK